MSKSKRATPAAPDNAKLESEADDNEQMAVAEEEASYDLVLPGEESEDAVEDSGEEVTPSWFGKQMSREDSQEVASCYRTVRANRPMFAPPPPYVNVMSAAPAAFEFFRK